MSRRRTSAQKVAQWLARNLPEQIQDGELDARDGHPEWQALPLVVRVGEIDAVDECLEIARVLADEERRDPACQDRPRRLEGCRNVRRRGQPHHPAIAPARDTARRPSATRWM